MRLIATSSWTTIWVIAAAWALALLFVNAIAVWWSIRAMTLERANGALAAFGGGLTPRGVLVVFGPPIALLMLRGIAARL